MSRKKNYVGELELQGKTFICGNWQVWPPNEVFLYGGQSAEEARGEMEIEAYTRLKIWEAACGLMKMEEEKCSTCCYLRPLVKPARQVMPPPLPRVEKPAEKKAMTRRPKLPSSPSSRKRKKTNF